MWHPRYSYSTALADLTTYTFMVIAQYYWSVLHLHLQGLTESSPRRRECRQLCAFLHQFYRRPL